MIEAALRYRRAGLCVLPAVQAEIAIARAAGKPIRFLDPLSMTTCSQHQKRGIAAILGQWPGDESDEEAERMLEELS